MEKADSSYFEVEAPNGISLIMLWESSVTFSAKIRKSAFLSNKSLNERGYSALNDPVPIELHTKHIFSKNVNK